MGFMKTNSGVSGSEMLGACPVLDKHPTPSPLKNPRPPSFLLRNQLQMNELTNGAVYR
jgi:hypothetical protein